jgi:hypothetical protein
MRTTYLILSFVSLVVGGVVTWISTPLTLQSSQLSYVGALLGPIFGAIFCFMFLVFAHFEPRTSSQPPEDQSDA